MRIFRIICSTIITFYIIALVPFPLTTIVLLAGWVTHVVNELKGDKKDDNDDKKSEDR